jgi:hypothetical protein
MPQIPEWVQLVMGGSLLVGLAAVLTVFATRKRDKTTDVQERFESSSDLAKYMRDEIKAEVERQVKPIRDELDLVKSESHEMNNVVRSREVQLWMWESDPAASCPDSGAAGVGELVRSACGVDGDQSAGSNLVPWPEGWGDTTAPAGRWVRFYDER